MAFFKFRQGEDAARSAPAQSLEVMRQRAKHRLIGSLVLVALAVVGFPLLIDKQPRPVPVDLPIDIPDKNKVKPLSLPAAPAKPAAEVAAPAETVPEPTKPAASTVVPAAASLSSQEVIETKPKAKPEVKPEPKPEVKPEVKAEIKPEAKAETKPPVDSGERAKALLEGKDPAKAVTRLVIQVGAFEDSKQVSDIRTRLERAGIKTYTQVVDTKDGKRTRVRVGPFETKADADKAVEKIKKLDLPASILTL